MGEQREFVAFISYRHCPMDMAVAKRVQNLIERYRIPRQYRRNGKKRLGLVFRDESELPLSSNLTKDIYNALDHSAFLIVVCTPETPKSLWVRQEIDYFIKTHGRDRVLAILADGMPDESLPEALTHVYAEDGSVLSRIEPLCANLVAEDQDAVLKRLNMEFLRLVAAMLKVPYDNLYQRRKRYLRRRAAALTGSVTAVLALIIGLLISWNLDVMAKNEEIAQNYRLAQEKESQALSLLSEQYLAAGDRQAALESALQALEGDRPYLPQAEGALANALNPYGNGMLGYHITLKQPTTVSGLDLSKDGTRLVTVDTNNRIRCYDTATGKVLWEYQSDAAVAAYGGDDFRLVDGEESLLVNTHDALHLLSMADGTLRYSLNLRYEKGSYEASAQVVVSGEEDRITLFYEPTGVHRYEVYDAKTGSLLENLTVNADKDCFFHGDLIAAYDKTKDQLLVKTDSYSCVLENVNPRDVTMDLLQLHTHPLDDGSRVLVCYLEDSHYSLSTERRWLSIHKLDSRGTEVHRQQMVRDVDLHHRFVGDYLALMEDEYRTSLEFSTFGTVMTLQDMTRDFKETVVDFGNAGVHDCYIRRDGQLVTVMTDGSILTPLKEEYGIVYTDLPDYGQQVRYGAAADGELVCLVPENGTDTVVMLRSARNENARSLGQMGQVIPFPDGTRFLTVEFDGETYEKPPVVTVYDTVTLEKLDRFTLEPEEGYTTILGFSADETRLFFGREDKYAYDLNNHTVTKVIDALEFPGVGYQQPQSAQRPGEPVLSMTFGGQDWNELRWYADLEQRGSFRYPLRETDQILPDWVNWIVGGNGLVICSAVPKETIQTPTEHFVYSTKDQTCHRVPNNSSEEGTGSIGTGNVTKTVAFADTDGILRLYDFDRDTIIGSFPLPVSPHEVSALQFVGQDQYLMIFKRNGSVTFMDITAGTVLAELLLDDPVDSHSRLVTEDPQNGQLYICTQSGSTSGYRIDMNSWQVTATIPGLAAYLPRSGQILQWDFYTGELLASPVYTCQELMDQTVKLLGGSAE